MALSSWPAYTDDTGSKTDGTLIDETLLDAIKAAIEADIESTTNPSEVLADIIDEVVDARGSMGSIDARLDVALEENGALKAQSGQATTAQLTAQYQGNWVENSDFLFWSAGDSAAPDMWALAGAGASVARTGTGLGDTTTQVGPYSVKVTRAAADASLSHNILSTASFAANGQNLQGATFTFGAWVQTSTASHARVQISDGVTTEETDYHTGGGGWEFLAETITLDASATIVTIKLLVDNSSGDAYFSGVTFLPGSVDLADSVPTPMVRGAIVFKIKGTVATGNDKDEHIFARPARVIDVQLTALTAPTDAALIVDLNQNTTSMHSTLPQIDAAASAGEEQPDGTYQYRCFAGYSGDTPTTARLAYDVTQVGSTEAGQDLSIFVRAEQYNPPHLGMKLYNDLGI